MSRHISLIRFETLSNLYNKSKDGVPLLKLLRIYKLSITRPTLARNLQHYRMYEECRDEEVKLIIYQSLNPIWMQETKEDVLKQPPNYYYSGIFPLGKWCKK